MPDLKVVSEYQPAGDQPQAIDKLAQGLENGLRAQVLKGVTGSGKTYTMAKVIERVNRPTLVLAHNKTLAAQLCEEFREFFPNNAVEYFVSYYDYYQPEAYVPQTDTYIEKDASTNEEIDRLRLSATCALLERRDVIVVASVSCIYGLGEPDDFARMMISLRTGMTLERDELLRRLVEDRYERNDVAFQRNVFRVRGVAVGPLLLIHDHDVLGAIGGNLHAVAAAAAAQFPGEAEGEGHDLVGQVADDADADAVHELTEALGRAEHFQNVLIVNAADHLGESYKAVTIDINGVAAYAVIARQAADRLVQQHIKSRAFGRWVLGCDLVQHRLLHSFLNCLCLMFGGLITCSEQNHSYQKNLLS